MSPSKAQGVAIEGLEECIEMLEKTLPKEALTLSRNAVHSVAGKVRNNARKRAPSKDGLLKRSIKTRKNKARRNQVSSDVLVGPEAFYWRFTEFGTVKQEAKPFFQPSVEEMAPKIPDLFKQEVGKKLEALLKRKARKTTKGR